MALGLAGMIVLMQFYDEVGPGSSEEKIAEQALFSSGYGIPHIPQIIGAHDVQTKLCDSEPGSHC